jgi:hypothetical protein
MRIRPNLLAPLLLVAPLAPASSATGQLANTLLQLRFEIPSAAGSYDGTRFDWSGMIRSLRVQGHEVYGPWFDRIDAATHNNVQRVLPDGTGQVITGIASSGQGPSEEFLTEDKALECFAGQTARPMIATALTKLSIEGGGRRELANEASCSARSCLIARPGTVMCTQRLYK